MFSDTNRSEWWSSFDQSRLDERRLGAADHLIGQATAVAALPFVEDAPKRLDPQKTRA